MKWPYANEAEYRETCRQLNVEYVAPALRRLETIKFWVNLITLAVSVFVLIPVETYLIYQFWRNRP